MFPETFFVSLNQFLAVLFSFLHDTLVPRLLSLWTCTARLQFLPSITLSSSSWYLLLRCIPSAASKLASTGQQGFPLNITEHSLMLISMLNLVVSDLLQVCAHA